MKHPIQFVLFLIFVGVPLSWAIWDANRLPPHYEELSGPTPVGYGTVYWYPDDILYSTSSKPYPLKGQSMVVVGFTRYEND